MTSDTPDCAAPREYCVVELDSTATHDLRRRVLRNNTASADVELDGDDLSTTVHLGVIDCHAPDRRVPLAISTWIDSPMPEAAASLGRGVQLRAMATEPSMRGAGLATMLLDAGAANASRAGVSHVWANARLTALGFYVARGYSVVGDEFVTADTALAHRRVLLLL